MENLWGRELRNRDVGPRNAFGWGGALHCKPKQGKRRGEKTTKGFSLKEKRGLNTRKERESVPVGAWTVG